MGETVRILLLEDQDAETGLADDLLAASQYEFIIEKADPTGPYIEVLEAFEPDVVLCDPSTSHFCEKIQPHLVRMQTRPIFILLTDSSREADAIALLDKGIDDYVLRNRPITFRVVIRKAVERRKAEKVKEEALAGLKAQEQRFRALLENSYEAISLLDANLNLLYRSPSIERIAGYSLAEMSGITMFDLLHPEDEQTVKELFKQVLATPGTPLRDVFRARHKSGEYVWLDTTVTNMLNDRYVQAIVCNYRDITENKRNERQLQQTGNYFKALLENISDAIILISREGLINYVSPSVKRTLGFEPEEMLRQYIYIFLHPDDVENGIAYVRDAVQKPDAPRHNSYRLKHKKGGYIWVGGTLTNMLKEESVKGLIINYHDITRRRLSQQLLRKSEANLRTVLENTKVAYVLVDRQYKVVSFNQLAKERYKPAIGVELAESINIIDSMPGNRREESRRDFERIFNGEKISYERDFLHPDGQTIWYQVDLLPVHDNYNAVLGLLISSEDITQRKNAEIEREKMISDIIQHNKNLEQFAYIISHNLRSPVANIIGLSNLINNPGKLSSQDFNKCMEGLVITAKRLDDIISDLNFILQQRREVTAALENVSFTGLMHDVLTLLHDLLVKEHIVIQTELQVDGIFTVRSYLHSIFLNLITNSIKYRRPELQTVIRVSTYKEGNKIKITFADNGLGIDMNLHGEKIFGLYKKFHPHIEGKGMGLYMVKTQVEMLGGTISIQSAINEGTIFEISFPGRQHLFGAH